jgi:hypothetical protein
MSSLIMTVGRDLYANGRLPGRNAARTQSVPRQIAICAIIEAFTDCLAPIVRKYMNPYAQTETQLQMVHY